MGSLSPLHWIVILIIVVLIFGTKKLRNIGGDLGAAVKNFKEGMKGDEEKQKQQDPKVIEGEAKDKTHSNN